MTVHYAMQVPPDQLDEYDDRWCHACGRRVDAAPLRGGCDCPPERCEARPAWLQEVLA